jgi:hypothetical protein
MTNSTHSSDGPQNPPFIFIGCFLGIAFWIIEAYFDSLMIDNTSFQQRLFPSDPNELWMRGFICALFVGFGLYAHIITTRMRSVESMNLDAALLLRNALSKTIRGNFPICVYCKKFATRMASGRIPTGLSPPRRRPNFQAASAAPVIPSGLTITGQRNSRATRHRISRSSIPRLSDASYRAKPASGAHPGAGQQVSPRPLRAKQREFENIVNE